MAVKKRYIWGVLWFFLAFILQTTVLKHVAILGWSPNILLCLVAVYSFLYEEKIGLVMGIIFGILLDFSINLYIGPSSFAFVLAYGVAMIIKRVFNNERLLPEILLATLVTPIYLFVIWLFYIIGGNPMPISVVISALPVLILYNDIIVVLLHVLLVRGVIKRKQEAGFKGNFKLRGGF
jgi:rod shape-determining protein MreD